MNQYSFAHCWLLPERIYGTSNGKNFSYTTQYDQYYRIKSKKEETPDFIYTTNTIFDSFGRADEVTISTTLQNPNYTTSSKVKNVYDNNGILIQQNNALTNSTIWHISAANALGKTTGFEMKSGFTGFVNYELGYEVVFNKIGSDANSNSYKDQKAFTNVYFKLNSVLRIDSS